MKAKLPTASQELQFLRFVARHGPLTVGRMTEELGAELGLSRSTVLTVLERLRSKGHVRRRRKDGVFVYASSLPLDRLMHAAVGQFVERSLGGSVLPFAAWLSERVAVTEEELAELRHIVARLKSSKETS
ncbi:MAG: MarR family transcriptional regulator [Candidatus Eisenbacteria bacterium]|uniref:MarR family transcriptional regulator n=1 Tax=Eiseniibacteriota bacterium TaxID=2212470 RepID=A0A849SU44_UNCEI|nr:MarR family transcriptional regulator [Candidatus Eisenbacteria bacterium]